MVGMWAAVEEMMWFSPDNCLHRVVVQVVQLPYDHTRSRFGRQDKSD